LSALLLRLVQTVPASDHRRLHAIEQESLAWSVALLLLLLLLFISRLLLIVPLCRCNLYHYSCCREPTSWMARFFNLNVPIVASRMPHWPHGILIHKLLSCAAAVCSAAALHSASANYSAAAVCLKLKYVDFYCCTAWQGADQLDGALLQPQRAHRGQPHRHAAAAG
jgi:hypothetical protein